MPDKVLPEANLNSINEDLLKLHSLIDSMDRAYELNARATRPNGWAFQTELEEQYGMTFRDASSIAHANRARDLERLRAKIQERVTGLADVV